MTTVTEQFAKAQKTGYEAMFGVTEKAIDGLEKIALLNIQAVKATLSESHEFATQAVLTQHAQGLLDLQSTYAQPLPQKVKSYWEHVSTIFFDTQDELAAAADERMKQYREEAQAFVRSVVDSASVSDTGLSPWKTAFLAADEAAASAKNTTERTGSQVIESASEITQAPAAEASRPVIVAEDKTTKG
jgi:phasin family protein